VRTDSTQRNWSIPTLTPPPTTWEPRTPQESTLLPSLGYPCLLLLTVPFFNHQLRAGLAVKCHRARGDTQGVSHSPFKHSANLGFSQRTSSPGCQSISHESGGWKEDCICSPYLIYSSDHSFIQLWYGLPSKA
jgi:hypothetical protein